MSCYYIVSLYTIVGRNNNSSAERLPTRVVSDRHLTPWRRRYHGLYPCLSYKVLWQCTRGTS